ncbi:hypothetical protein [Terriglobus sp. ADX1]|uniref:hypothetical protein n=1 Tax=Terriglobus sp. ADX1 TaxID=2794063 RepID=UPI002FE68EE3
MNSFAPNDRVIVSPDFFWAKGALGTVNFPPSEVIAISGEWPDGLTHQEHSALGEHTVYWVWFDEPQFDADHDGPFRGGCIWATALTKVDAPAKHSQQLN